MKLIFKIYKTRISMLNILCIGLFLLPLGLYAQVTNIPDPNFEQALIDLGIDSDGIINGQVLTSDIENVVTLDVNHRFIEDLTGLEDFSALELLDASGNILYLLDVSENILLKELYFNSQSPGFSMLMTSLDFSSNVNLEIVEAANLIFLENLNLKNGVNSILTISLPCEFEGEPCELTELQCVNVDDEVAANNNELPYSRWYVAADFIYSEDCSLGTNDINEKLFSIYPNPVNEVLVLNGTKNISNLKTQIYSTEGKILNTQHIDFNKQTSIDVLNLSSGIYFLNIEDQSGRVEVKKFIKQ